MRICRVSEFDLAKHILLTTSLLDLAKTWVVDNRGLPRWSDIVPLLAYQVALQGLVACTPNLRRFEHGVLGTAYGLLEGGWKGHLQTVRLSGIGRASKGGSSSYLAAPSIVLTGCGWLVLSVLGFHDSLDRSNETFVRQLFLLHNRPSVVKVTTIAPLDTALDLP